MPWNLPSFDVQTLIKTAVDTIKTVVDSIKTKVDTTATKVDAIDVKVGTLLDGRVVKSIQRGTMLVAANPSYDVTLSPVNTSKTLVFYTLHSKSTTIGAYYVTAFLQSSTMLRFVKENSEHVTLSWQVIEFY